MKHAFIAVHTGAGFYKTDKDSVFKKLCRSSCSKALELLEDGESAVDAVCSAVTVLEDDPITNAGFGSNLTRDGKIECDASVMDATSGLFGACGAVSGVKNPVLLAKTILQKQSSSESNPLGLIRPMMLVGDGARKFASASGLDSVDASALITEHRRHRLHKYLELELSYHTDSSLCSAAATDDAHELDTVGAIAVDLKGNVAAAVSSGGLLLKLPGRVGQAGVYGAGVWCERGKGDVVACCTSGTGEELIRTDLARQLSRHVLGDNSALMSDVVHSTFISNYEAGNRPKRYMGALLLHVSDWEDTSAALLHVTHTTPSFCWARASTKDRKPKAEMSRMEQSQTSGSSVMAMGYPV